MKRVRNNLFALVCAILFTACLLGCGAEGGHYPVYPGTSGGSDITTSVSVASGDTFQEITERGFVTVAQEPTSAFSLSTSRSAYTYMRGQVERGYLPSKDAVRIEEYINYFDYGVTVEDGEDFAAVTNVFACPWNEAHKLLRVTYAARSIERTGSPNNLVFLVDVSASMYGEDRIGLFKTAMQWVAQSLDKNDTVSVVTYASGYKVVLDGKSGDRRDEIVDTVNAIQIGGRTYGVNAIDKAYEVARDHFIKDGNNRVILFTDGDFNVGLSDPDALGEWIAAKRETGIFFTGVGVGYGNYRDDVLEALASAGNGEAYYLDGASEARRVFGENLTGTLYTVACDAKAQLAFDGGQVDSYRLLGYDNRMLTGIQFEDEKTDAGEIGSGRQVTVLYEIVPTATYDQTKAAATAQLRYRDAAGAPEKTLNVEVTGTQESDDDRFIACVAEYGLLLRQSIYAQGASFAALTERLNAMELQDGYKSEFRTLATRAAQIADR